MYQLVRCQRFLSYHFLFNLSGLTGEPHLERVITMYTVSFESCEFSLQHDVVFINARMHASIHNANLLI